MEEEAPSRRSVAELAGRFKGSTPHDAAGNETEKPVRRRPPRSLQLPKPHGDDQEPPGVTSPAKAKRNSALIEKLQANLALSPTALLPSPKSPGFRLLPPAFTPPSPGSTPVSMTATSSTASPASPVATAAPPLTEEEGPTSFEDPPTVAEGTILSNSNIKGRARHSIRRRPPSRRHRKSSCGDEVGIAIEGGDASPSSPTEPKDKTAAGGGEASKEEGKTDEVTEDKTSTHPEKNESCEEDELKVSVEPRGEDEEKKEGSTGAEEGDGSSSGRKEEEEEAAREKNSEEKQKDLIERATNTESKEEEQSEETTSPTSAR